ncbi:hypothetical protein O181_004184 [Austropuccinia psidii MF-1]|uniref:Uncharacterized protein n=1 Tax=Austropuccinia psidii MF-1 TaxID=1389203 RepID=A0A9Q3GEL2_9BASI|nr:hypothetical protein [Austropuccinia psidii MF-1]
MEAPKAYKRKNLPQKVPKTGKKAPKTNQKGKPKWNRTYPQRYRIPNKEKTAIKNVFKMEGTFQIQGGGKDESTPSKEIDIVNIVAHFEACNKEIFTKLL